MVAGGDQMQDRQHSCLNGEVLLHEGSESVSVGKNTLRTPKWRLESL